MMRRSRLLTVLAAASLAGPAAAQAQHPGVNIDPDSPTSKEYEIPLEGARRDAAGGGGQQEQPPAHGERSAPLFGEGVSPDEPEAPAAPSTGGGEDAAAGGGGASRNGKRAHERSGAAKPRDTGDGAEPVLAAAGRTRTSDDLAVLRAATSTDGGFSDIATIAALAFAVLVLGGVLGSILRRRGA